MLTIARLFLPLIKYPYHGRHIACPVCEGQSWRIICRLDRRLKHLPTAMCNHCGLLYTNPMPTDAELGIYYAELYRFDYQMAVSAPKEQHIRKRDREAQARIGALEGLLKPGARTLDFGCGSGEFVSQMVEAQYDAQGFEPGESYGNYARQRLGDRIRVARWQDVEYGEKFDLVTCFHVIEHLNDPLAAIRKLVSWLKPGGLAYIEVPDLMPERDRKGFGFFHFAHVIGFGHHTLVLAAARAGLVPVRKVSPTGIIFRLGASEDPELLAARGLAAATEHFVTDSPYRRYLAYQAGKLFKRPKKNPPPVRVAGE